MEDGRQLESGEEPEEEREGGRDEEGSGLHAAAGDHAPLRQAFAAAARATPPTARHEPHRERHQQGRGAEEVEHGVGWNVGQGHRAEGGASR